MATPEQHIAKAERNAAFAESLVLDSPAHIEWAFVSLFYSGLHYVEAYLSKIKQPEGTHNTHAKRDRLIVMNPRLSSIRREYYDLKNLGLKARYECLPMSAASLQEDAFPALEVIKVHIRAMV